MTLKQVRSAIILAFALTRATVQIAEQGTGIGQIVTKQ